MRLGASAWRASFWLCLVLALLAPPCTRPVSARTAEMGSMSIGPANTTSRGVFKICHDQTYALCAVASCFVFNGLAYCTCDIKKGDSISLPFHYGRGKDVCSVNAEGVGNGFMVSTYSLPPSVKAPRGDQALYSCPPATSTGAYAQCDGGICFRSTQGQDFPGSTKPIGPNQIICSCPVTEPRKTLPQREARVGYQISGPWQKRDGTACTGSDSASDCCSSGPQWPQGDWFSKFCFPSDSKPATGDIVPVGAPTGTGRALSLMLDGPPSPQVNMCQIEQRGRPR